MAPALSRTGKRPSPKLSKVLGVPLQPSLWLRPATATSLRSPVNCASAPTSRFGTMKSEIPRVPGMAFPAPAPPGRDDRRLRLARPLPLLRVLGDRPRPDVRDDRRLGRGRQDPRGDQVLP